MSLESRNVPVAAFAFLLVSLLLKANSAFAAELVSVNAAGTGGGNGHSFVNSAGASSSDGQVVVFESYASDLVATDANELKDIFARNLQTGITVLVSQNVGGTGSGNSDSKLPECVGCAIAQAVSADGRFVVFVSWASDLVSSDSNGVPDVFVRDLQTGTTHLVSENMEGTGSGNEQSGEDNARAAAITPDGRFVVFESYASDLVPNDSNGQVDVFVRDLQTSSTTLISVNRFASGSADWGAVQPSISADGRFIAFASGATDLVLEETYGTGNIYVRDRQEGITTLVSVSADGSEGGDSYSFRPQLSSDGTIIVYASEAENLGPVDTNGLTDVYVRDLVNGTTSLVTGNSAATDSANGASEEQALSGDGRFVAFLSEASDLVSTDTNSTWDVFVRDLLSGVTTLVSVNQNGTDSGNAESRVPVISEEGRFVAFQSDAGDLVATDTNGLTDVFVRDLQTGRTIRMNDSADAATSGPPSLSADGRFVVFTTSPADFGPTGNFGISDVYRAPTSTSDGAVGPAGGMIADSAGTGAAFQVDSGVLAGDIAVTIEVLSSPGVDPPAGFSAFGTFFVSFLLDPNPSPIPAPGAAITLPLEDPLVEGTVLDLFKYDPGTGTFIDTGIDGAVDAGGATATFAGVTSFSTFVGLVREAQIDTIAPALSLPEPITVEATGASGAAVSYSVSATDDVDPSPTVSCTPAFGSTFPLGTTTVTCTATDATGNIATGSFNVTVSDTTPPSLTLPENLVVAAAGESGTPVPFSVSAADSVDSNPAVTCIPASGSTFTPGITTVVCTAIDASGNSSQGTFTVQVTYGFVGFLSPIANDGSGIFKSGRVVPAKFQLTRADGSFVTNAGATVDVFKFTDDVLGTREEVTPDAAGESNTDNLFRFDSSTNEYIYNLKTTGYTSGTYLLRAAVSDGTHHEVAFSVR